MSTASSTLAVFEPDTNELLGLLVRLALSDSSPSSMAVLQSTLALSSFHRHGLQAGVYGFKDRALRTLVGSCTPGIKSPMVAQHIAASMLLCHLEVCSRFGPWALDVFFASFFPFIVWDKQNHTEQMLTNTQDARNAKYSLPVVL